MLAFTGAGLRGFFPAGAPRASSSHSLAAAPDHTFTASLRASPCRARVGRHAAPASGMLASAAAGAAALAVGVRRHSIRHRVAMPALLRQRGGVAEQRRCRASCGIGAAMRRNITAERQLRIDVTVAMASDGAKTSAPSRPPRVRFAPSPTGVLHVGGARTALFNYLFAKSQGGELILRVEDTDVARSTSESERAILEDLRWCGIHWDEGPDIGGAHGPYRQSDRIKAGIYQEQLDKLIAEGHVYRCFLSEEELDMMRKQAEQNGQAFVIDSPWAHASEHEINDMLGSGKPYAYRFRVPRDKTIEIEDLVLGEVSWGTDDLGGDFVIVRQNGMPMYNFGVAVDDAKMGITHVLRAQEHLSNTPKQILLYEAMGLEVPKFGHMPLILAPDRSKLSKRYGAVSVHDYQQMGYLPSSMVNYLAQLGWNDGTNKEIYNLQELLDSFKMERMSKVAAIFDKDKFKWVNGQHLRRLSDDEAISMIGNELVEKGVIKEASGEFAHKACFLLRERLSVVADAAEALKKMLSYPLKETLASDHCEEWLEDGGICETAELVIQAKADGALERIGKDPEAIKGLAKAVGEARGARKKQLLMPLRICLTGAIEGPNMSVLFDMLDSVDSNVLCECVPLSDRVEQLAAEIKRMA